MHFVVVSNCIGIITNMLNFVKLTNGVQLQQLILGCGTTGNYLNFTFMKNALLVKYEYEQINYILQWLFMILVWQFKRNSVCDF